MNACIAVFELLTTEKHNYLNFVETEQVTQGNLRIAKARACHVRM